jgi:hypothetical protein
MLYPHRIHAYAKVVHTEPEIYSKAVFSVLVIEEFCFRISKSESFKYEMS